MTSPADRLALSIPEAAKLTSLSEENIRDRCVSGEIPAKRVGRRWLIPVKALEAWLNDPTPVEDGSAA